MTALINTSITIQCPTNGVPPPTVTWTKDGLEIPSGGRYKVQDDGSLVISKADEKDNAQYTCTSSNVAGNSSASSSVQIVGKNVWACKGFFTRCCENSQLSQTYKELPNSIMLKSDVCEMVKYCFQRDKESQDFQKSPYILDAGADVSVLSQLKLVKIIFHNMALTISYS